jgi:hypothetical protein
VDYRGEIGMDAPEQRSALGSSEGESRIRAISTPRQAEVAGCGRAAGRWIPDVARAAQMEEYDRKATKSTVVAGTESTNDINNCKLRNRKRSSRCEWGKNVEFY